MSAEATLAVMEHADGASPSEWRMLMLLANEANASGVTTGISMETLAKRMGIKDRAIAGVKNRLKKAGRLVILDQGGGRGRTAVYWIKLPGLDGPEETPQIHGKNPADGVQNESQTPHTRSSKNAGRSISSSLTTSSSTKAAKEKEFLDILAESKVFYQTEGPDPEELLDGLELLRRGQKVGGRMVQPIEMAIAAACIATFNRCFEWKGKSGSDYGLGANLTSIVERARQRPSWDICKHVRLVESAWRIRWWEKIGRNDRRPHPNVIWGPKSFENVVQDAGDEAAGQTPTEFKQRYDEFGWSEQERGG